MAATGGLGFVRFTRAGLTPNHKKEARAFETDPYIHVPAFWHLVLIWQGFRNQGSPNRPYFPSLDEDAGT